LSKDSDPDNAQLKRGLEKEIELLRRDRDAAQLRLLGRRLTDAMAWRRSEERLDDMRQALAAAQDQLAGTRDQLAEARRRIEQMEASTSWRITAPLRAVMRRLRGDAGPPAVAVATDVPPPPVAAPAALPTVSPSPRLDRPREAPPPGLDPAEGPSRVAVLLASTGGALGLDRCVASAQLALRRAGSAPDVALSYRGEPPLQVDKAVRLIPMEDGFSLARMQNLLLADGFARGAEVCVIADPAGLFHPDSLCALLGVLASHHGRALVEALRFPHAHPKAFDPATLETAWAGGHCLAISRPFFDTLGGFDEGLCGSRRDVELSQRAKGLGWPVLTAPHALFLVDGNGAEPGEPAWTIEPPAAGSKRDSGGRAAGVPA